MTKIIDNPDFIHGTDLDAVRLAAHNRSLSADPLKACEGRATKAMIDIFEAWMDGENERGTDKTIITLTSVSVGMSFITSTIASLTPNNAAAAGLMQVIAPHLQERWQKAVEHAEKVGATEEGG